MPETAVLRKACSHDWPLAGVWELGLLGGSYHFVTKSGLLCLDYTNMVYEEQLFSFWESGILVCARQSACDQPPITNGHNL